MFMSKNKIAANGLSIFLIAVLISFIILSVQYSEADSSVKLALNSIVIGVTIATLIFLINFFHTQALHDDILDAIAGKKDST